MQYRGLVPCGLAIALAAAALITHQLPLALLSLVAVAGFAHYARRPARVPDYLN